MALIAANEGELTLLGWMLRDTSVTDGVHVHLYTNDYTPLATSTVASFTEATFTGYADVTLSRATWGAPSTVSGKASSTYGTDPTFTCSGGASQTCYGYYVTTVDDATLLWAERFDTSRTIASGETLTVVVKATLNSEN